MAPTFRNIDILMKTISQSPNCLNKRDPDLNLKYLENTDLVLWLSDRFLFRPRYAKRKAHDQETFIIDGGSTADVWKLVNTLRPRRNQQHFADDIFKRIFFNKNVCILIKLSLNFVRKGPINNIPALVQIMTWRRSGDKPLSEPMMVSLPTHICVTRPQWVKWNLFAQSSGFLIIITWVLSICGSYSETFIEKVTCPDLYHTFHKKIKSL